MKRICVFCGSSSGKKPEYLRTARALADVFLEKGIDLVYGGGNVGMMGEIARMMMDNGGEVIGVMPKFLADKEVGFENVTQFHVVDSMHERKAMMAEFSDAFIALPGGLGTLEEIFEVFTWAQLGIHEKACGFLNVCGYYDLLLSFIDYAIAEGFIKSDYRRIVMVEESPARLLRAFENHRPIHVDKARWALALKQRAASF
ncbi:TIGR00730 family Rossman fold protein [candidate division KSB3 bacterium]|uniref:Cytokinin riboside 5'-monophosphate phosphoribohydrolase n=1 Tax=candidate division KSB3 bacterium TaxID=2044937 RepID=A0A2G6E844_9BACT|nr:MAG: TIGR00730 family Rossman fold protein [candidate division KSB3 bacterium]PIE30567.1 MAG: TIGR00730 family Rossman fold protein [candidate division KSB3 bacterium]